MKCVYNCYVNPSFCIIYWTYIWAQIPLTLCLVLWTNGPLSISVVLLSPFLSLADVPSLSLSHSLVEIEWILAVRHGLDDRICLVGEFSASLTLRWSVVLLRIPFFIWFSFEAFHRCGLWICITRTYRHCLYRLLLTPFGIKLYMICLLNFLSMQSRSVSESEMRFRKRVSEASVADFSIRSWCFAKFCMRTDRFWSFDYIYSFVFALRMFFLLHA